MKHRKSGKLNRCLEILKLLEIYSQELLKTDAKISQGEDVIQFFKAQTQDLDPSFPENRCEIIFVFLFVCVFMKQEHYRIQIDEKQVTYWGSRAGRFY